MEHNNQQINDQIQAEENFWNCFQTETKKATKKQNDFFTFF